MSLPPQAPPAVLPRLSLVSGLLLATLLLGAVFTLSLPADRLWLRVLEDTGHGPVFGGLAVVLLLLQSPAAGTACRAPRQYLWAFCVAVALGIATELAQWTLPDRSVSAADVLHDAAGAALGLALAWSIERMLARRRGVTPRDAQASLTLAIALCAFSILAWQPLQGARAYAVRAAAWPTLLPLGAPAEAAFTRLHAATASHAPLPALYRRPGDPRSLRLEFKPGSRPGVQLLEPRPDWSGHDALVIDLTNPASQPAHLVLRILDATHDWTHADRFNQQLVIPARTRTTVRISLAAVAASPRARRMNLTAIANVMLFAQRPLQAGELYLTRVWLE